MAYHKNKSSRLFPAKDMGTDKVQKKCATTDSSVGGGASSNMASKTKKASPVKSSGK